MAYSDTQGRDELMKYGKSLFERRLTSGASANISVRTESGFLISPTNSCIGFLDRQTLSQLDGSGEWIAGDKPSKEFALHKAFYDQRPEANAVIHLHSTYATALSCLDLPEESLFPPLTPYLIIRLGQVAIVPYFAPGDDQLAHAIREKAANSTGVLMANHGPIVCGKDFATTMYAIEEMEESAKITLLLNSLTTRQISVQDVRDLMIRYGHTVN